MAKGIYAGVGGLAKKVKTIYVGNNGAAKKVKKVFVGVNGEAKLCWTGHEKTLFLINGNEVSYSKDGNTFTYSANGFPGEYGPYYAAVLGEKTYLECNYEIYSTTDGITYTLETASPPRDVYDCPYIKSVNGRLFIMLADSNGKVASSTDGKTWTMSATLTANAKRVFDIYYLNDKYYVALDTYSSSYYHMYIVEFDSYTDLINGNGTLINVNAVQSSSHYLFGRLFAPAGDLMLFYSASSSTIYAYSHKWRRGTTMTRSILVAMAEDDDYVYYPYANDSATTGKKHTHGTRGDIPLATTNLGTHDSLVPSVYNRRSWQSAHGINDELIFSNASGSFIIKTSDGGATFTKVITGIPDVFLCCVCTNF